MYWATFWATFSQTHLATLVDPFSYVDHSRMISVELGGEGDLKNQVPMIKRR
jgi:hypothetical protein